MKLWNNILEYLNRDIVAQYEEFMLNHKDAYLHWTQAHFMPRSVIPHSELTLFQQLDSAYVTYSQKFLNSETCSFAHKKFIVEIKDQILAAHKCYIKDSKLYSDYKHLCADHPLVAGWLIEKNFKIRVSDANLYNNLLPPTDRFKISYVDLCLVEGDFSVVRSFEDLSIEQKLIVASDNNTYVREYILSEIKKKILNLRKEKHFEYLEFIKHEFVTKVLNDSRRLRYYKQFMAQNGDGLKSYCVEHLDQLDAFVKECLKAEFDEIKKLYPDGLNAMDSDPEFFELKEKSEIDYWEKCVTYRNLIQDKHLRMTCYDDLCRKYPHGISRYYEENKNASIKDIVELGIDKLTQFEELAKEIAFNEAIFKSQAEFAEVSRDLHDEYFHDWSCQLLKIPICTHYLNGGHGTGYLNICHYFDRAYCSSSEIDCTLLPHYKIEYQKNIPRLKNLSIRFRRETYDQIVNYVLSLKERYGLVLVLFGCNGVSNEREFSDYHFCYLKHRLAEEGIFYGSQLINHNVSYFYKYVVIINLFSTKLSLLHQCLDVFTKFKASLPNIVCISLEREYRDNEMRSLLQAKEAELERVRKETERIEEEKREAEKKEQQRLQLERQRLEVERKRKAEILAKLQSCVQTWDTLYGGLHYSYLLKYYPTTCDFEATQEEWDDRYLVWNFKNTPGKTSYWDHELALDILIPRIGDRLISTFGNDLVKDLTLVCIPASTEEKTDARYRDFSNRICDYTGMLNSFEHIKVIHSKEERRRGGTSIRTEDLSISSEFFKDKNVLVFDDIITRGDSMRTFQSKMENLGANVIAGFSIGKTTHQRNI